MQPIDPKLGCLLLLQSEMIESQPEWRESMMNESKEHLVYSASVSQLLGSCASSLGSLWNTVCEPTNPRSCDADARSVRLRHRRVDCLVCHTRFLATYYSLVSFTPDVSFFLYSFTCNLLLFLSLVGSQPSSRRNECTSVCACISNGFILLSSLACQWTSIADSLSNKPWWDWFQNNF